MNLGRPHNVKNSECQSKRVAGPLRTCVGCRIVDLQSNLVRLTLEGTSLQVDDCRRNSGRGAYLHSLEKCFLGAEKGGFSRSFRMPIPRESIRLIREQMLKISNKNRGLL